VPGQKVEELIDELYQTPPELVAKVHRLTTAP
jgi:hypothetical protein